MHELFDDEIKAWKSAQASGVTLTDHVVSASVVEMTTPVSENEVSFLDDDDDDDDQSHQQSTEGMVTAATQPRQATIPPPLGVQPSVVVGRIDHTPMPAPPPLPISHAPSGPIRAIQHTPSGAVRSPTIPPPLTSQSGPFRIDQMAPVANAFAIETTNSAGFPIAPREWRDASSPDHDASRQQTTKRLMIGGMLGLAVVVVIALAAAGGGPPARPATELAPEPVETMHVIPQPTTNPDDEAPAVQPEVGEPVEPAPKPAAKPEPRSVPATKPAPTNPAPTTKPAPTKPAPTTKPVPTPEPQPVIEPEPEPATTPEPAAKPEPKPAAKPEPKPAAKPEPKPEHHHHTTPKKPDPTKPKTPTYDPNSALPPP